MNTDGQKLKRRLRCESYYRLYIYLTFSYASNVIAMICTLSCNQHSISNNNCAKYEHNLSKIKEELVLQAFNLPLRVFYPNLWLSGHIGEQKIVFGDLHIINTHSNVTESETFEPWHVISNNVAFVDSDEPVAHPFKLRHSKWCSVSSLTLIEYSSDQQRLWSDCAYA